MLCQHTLDPLLARWPPVIQTPGQLASRQFHRVHTPHLMSGSTTLPNTLRDSGSREGEVSCAMTEHSRQKQGKGEGRPWNTAVHRNADLGSRILIKVSFSDCSKSSQIFWFYQEYINPKSSITMIQHKMELSHNSCLFSPRGNCTCVFTFLSVCALSHKFWNSQPINYNLCLRMT